MKPHRGTLILVLGILGIVFCGIFTAILTNWSWWGFSNTYTGFLIFDHLVGWTLAGFVLAKITLPQPEPDEEDSSAEAKV